MVQNKECWFLKDSQVAGIIIENWYSFSAGRTYKNIWTYWRQQPSPCWCGDTTWDTALTAANQKFQLIQLYCQVGCSSDRRHTHTMIKCRQPLLGSHNRMSKIYPNNSPNPPRIIQTIHQSPSYPWPLLLISPMALGTGRGFCNSLSELSNPVSSCLCRRFSHGDIT